MSQIKKTKLNILRISDSKDLITDRKLLSEYITAHDKEINNRFQDLWDAYACNAEIFDTVKIPKKSLNKPDYRISVNYPRYVVDTYNGFASGIPAKIESDDDNVNEYIAQVCDYNGLDDINSEVHKLKCIFGEAYQILFVDELGEIATAVSDPLEAFPVYTDGLKPRIRYFIRTYYDEDNNRHGTISDAENVYAFDYDGSDIVFTEEHAHGFGDVPVVVYTMNSARIGLVEVILPMCNAYDKAISEKMNDVDAFADAIMKVLGATLNEEQMNTLRDKRIINVGGKDGQNVIVDFLARPSGDTTQEHLLERLEQLIFTVSMVCNVSDPNFATSSGIALRMKMEPMSNLAAGDWRLDQSSMKRFWRLVFSNPVNTVDDEAWRNIVFTHYLNYPDAITDSTDIAIKLNGLISKETQLSILPAEIVPDVTEELERIKSENEAREIIAEHAMQIMQNGKNNTEDDTDAEKNTDSAEDEENKK